MLKKLILENWKSFRYAELPLNRLTVLIGTNSSGRANVVEALEFFILLVQGKEIKTTLSHDATLPARQGSRSWTPPPQSQFTLQVVVQGEDHHTDYLYSITIQTKPNIRVIQESIARQYYQHYNQTNPVLTDLIKAYIKAGNELQIEVELYGRQFFYFPKSWNNHQSIFLQLKGMGLNDKMFWVISYIGRVIENIFILNPIPGKMRDYAPISDSLESNASNIAGVLASLTDQQKAEFESTVSAYGKHLPKPDIQKAWATSADRLGKDAMLYCQEQGQSGEIIEIDARMMSDGTLRFLAIITALLTRPEGSQLVIKEVDKGLPPDRLELLLKILKELSEKRNINIVITTQNPALLDALAPDKIPFVIVAHRDSNAGESQLTLLESIENFPQLFASVLLSKLASNGGEVTA